MTTRSTSKAWPSARFSRNASRRPGMKVVGPAVGIASGVGPPPPPTPPWASAGGAHAPRARKIPRDLRNARMQRPPGEQRRDAARRPAAGGDPPSGCRSSAPPWSAAPGRSPPGERGGSGTAATRSARRHARSRACAAPRQRTRSMTDRSGTTPARSATATSGTGRRAVSAATRAPYRRRATPRLRRRGPPSSRVSR